MIVRSAALALGLWSVLTEAVYYTIDTPGSSHDTYDSAQMRRHKVVLIS